MSEQHILSVGARIRQVRRHFSLKQADFGRKIGLSGSRVSELEHDKGGAGANVLMSICREFPVSHQWMLTGTGTMLKAEKSQKNRAEPENLTDRLRELEEQVRLILLDKGSSGPRLLDVPLYASAVAAGLPSLASCEVEDTIEIPESWSHGRKNLFAVRVQGESMLDAGIMPGDRLLVEATQAARDQQIVIASIDGEMTVKKLDIGRDGRVRLEPRNSAYETITISPEMDFRIHGIVLASIRHY